MYLEKLIDENIGPIEKVNIDFPFSGDGLPKPIIFVGENGSGKSTLISNIVDSFYSIAAERFNNALQPQEHGLQYYKAITPIEIHDGKEYLVSYITFYDVSPVHYVFKSGKLSAEEFKKEFPNCCSHIVPEEEDQNFKEVDVEKKDAERIFQKNVICYFGPDRYEKPMWLGEKYYGMDDNLHPSVKASWTGMLKNPISVKNVTETNLQWLIDVIVDSRPDVEEEIGSLQLLHINASVLLKMLEARHNLEAILSKIVGKDVYFALNLRNRGASRFKVVDRETNGVIAPTFDSLSSGQIALFNMFSTIVRYADDSGDLRKSTSFKDITGIVVIDEIELHLHTSLQKEVLPKLIKLFPKVQFVITSHAPLFLLGMKEEFGEDGFEVYEMPSATKISVERFSEFQHAYKYFKETQTYQKEAEAAIEKARSGLSSKVLIITEGSTDWKHMKTAMGVLKGKPEYSTLFNGLDFEFLEYEPANSPAQAQYKLEMGNKTLTSICENYAKMPHDAKYIFIADCDVVETTKKLGNESGRFKRWQNGIYSFTIPVPDSRLSTPNISIEHLFSDLEIKTEMTCDDDVARRLYMGNEFDKYGHAQAIDRFCERKEICGPDKINIIEGSQGDKIFSFSKPGVVNYALPKTAFAKYVSENPSKFNFENFVEIFKIIKEIIADGVTP